MKNTFRRLASFVLALTLTLALAVPASAAELRWDSLVAYGGKEMLIKAESITEEERPTEVVPDGPLKTYTCTAPVTLETNFVATAANPYPIYGVLKLSYDSTYNAYFLSLFKISVAG